MNFSKQMGLHLAQTIVEMIEIDEAGSDSLTGNFNNAFTKWQKNAPAPNDVGWRTNSSSDYKTNMRRNDYVDRKIAQHDPHRPDDPIKKHVDQLDVNANKKLAERKTKLQQAIAWLKSEISTARAAGRSTKTREKELKKYEDHFRKLAVPTQRKFNTKGVGADGLRDYEKD